MGVVAVWASQIWLGRAAAVTGPIWARCVPGAGFPSGAAESPTVLRPGWKEREAPDLVVGASVARSLA